MEEATWLQATVRFTKKVIYKVNEEIVLLEHVEVAFQGAWLHVMWRQSNTVTRVYVYPAHLVERVAYDWQ